jgi:transcriptional regulator
MYNPAHFAEDRPEVLHEFIRKHPLGALVTCGPAGLEASHIPVALHADEGLLRCHVARANPQSQTLASSPSVLMIFSGAQHYITPSWYPSKAEHGKVVPTWNYVAVHVSGRARLVEDEQALLRHLKDLTARNEASFTEPWAVDDAPPDFIANLMRSIVGIEILIDRIEGKWKLSQNRSKPDQHGVIEGLQKLESPESKTMAALMEHDR